MTKKTFFAAAAAFLFPFVALTACNNDEPNDNGKDDDKDKPDVEVPGVLGARDFSTSEMLGALDYIESPDIPSQTGVWTGWNVNEDLVLGEEPGHGDKGWGTLRFRHTYSEYMPGAGYAQGFTPSANFVKEIGEPWYEWQYSVWPDSSDLPALVACWDTSEAADASFDKRSLTIRREDGGLFAPEFAIITNTSYALLSMAHGNGFCTAFGPDSWLTVTAHGIPAEEWAEETTSTFYLAKGTDIVSAWEHWDLAGLGKVKGIYFTMDSSDSGAWGMNTPAYFALQNLAYTSFR